MVPPSFLERLAQCKKEQKEKEILGRLTQCKNDRNMIQHTLTRCNKTSSMLCEILKRIMHWQEEAYGKILPMCKDQGMFAISCNIGNVSIKKAMCDLGASINVMHLSIFKLLNTGPLKEIGVIIQLADTPVVYLEELLENVLVKLNELIFPVDFYIVEMEDDNSTNSFDILLGRPFLSTA
ncbi:Retrotransposon gag protein [Gossypium australe]|uniref:Retrotransposon gag protein n=1 Tax=Gossypium australe TaxID=47621 RepID=A0A5B6VW66_9ROSI|nr:Retrotransposon gag protein [Gossypium australe]